MEGADRETFEVMLEQLFAALDKPLTAAKREGFWKGLTRMSLLEFARCRDLLLEELEDGVERRTFSVPDVWGARKRLRARAPIQVPALPEWQGDSWDRAANRHLLAILMRRSLTGEGAVSASELPILLAAKRAWAQTMRESVDGNGVVDTETQQAVLTFHLHQALAQIAAPRDAA